MFEITVLISGNGSNLQTLMDHCENGLWRAKVNHVISNRKNAYGLIRADEKGIRTSYLPYYSKRETRSEYEIELLQVILSQKPNLIVCAGWMHVLGPEFLDILREMKIPVINLHPALPSQFPGTDGIGDAYRAFRETLRKSGVKSGKTGCMVHYVIPEIDAGEVISTFEVPIYESDSQEDLRKRVQMAEKPCLIQAVTKIILDQLD